MTTGFILFRGWVLDDEYVGPKASLQDFMLAHTGTLRKRTSGFANKSVYFASRGKC